MHTIPMAFLLGAGLAAGATAQTNGLFATFETSLGSFTCELAIDQAPVTCANFVGLAEGSRGWLRLPNGQISRRPFYDGLTVHRVVDGFVIQAGSPNGDGTDGPGYTFPDEFNTNLLHDAAGVLSMANSGPNSNGSQFFVTLAPTPGLNFIHSVFGRVVSGLEVVQAIGDVPVDDQEKPLGEVRIEHVTLERIGPAAQAFDPNDWPLPELQPAPVYWVHTPQGLALDMTRQEDHEYLLYETPDLAAWSRQRIGLYIDPPTQDPVPVETAPETSRMLHVVDVSYPGPLRVPPSIANSTIELVRPGQKITLLVGADGTGPWILSDPDDNLLGAGTMTASWEQQPYRGGLLILFDLLSPRRHFLVFTSDTAGFYRGTVFPSSGPSFPVQGTFSLTIP